MKQIGIAVLIAISQLTAFGQTPAAGVTALRLTTDPMRTPLNLAGTVALNDKSSLKREWVVLKNPAMPAQFSEAVGPKILYKDPGFVYDITFALELKQSLSAIQVIFLIFDVWGNHINTLRLDEIKDGKPGFVGYSGQWHIIPEAEAELYYASIGYVSRVKLADGKVIVADTRPIIDEARKYSTKFTETDLEQQKK